jgi:EAL domain-containing protein (putative c-di-GMP-specific phosphodiesterase class I)
LSRRWPATYTALARALDLKVIPEGAETEEQAKLLRLLKCDELQGYLLGLCQLATS